MSESPKTGAGLTPGRRSRIATFAAAAIACGFAVVLYSASLRSPPVIDGPVALRGTKASPPGATLRSHAHTPERLRLISFNIHSGKSAGGLTRTGDVIRAALPPDGGVPAVIGLNEVRNPLFGPDQAACLAKDLGARFSSAFLPAERRWLRNHYGNGLLTDAPAGATVVKPLPRNAGRARRSWGLTTVSLGPSRVSVFVTHADSRGDRDNHLQIVTSLFLTAEPPAVLMGDLNARPDHPVLTSMAPLGAIDALVDSDAGPLSTTHIDHIFVRGLDVLDAAIVPNDASDHPLVWAGVRLREVAAGEGGGGIGK